MAPAVEVAVLPLAEAAPLWVAEAVLGGGWRTLLRRFLLLAVLLLFLFLFLFRLSLSALNKGQAVCGDCAGGGAKSKNESSSEAAATADRHVLIDPKISLRRPRVLQAEPVQRPRVLQV